MRVFADVGEAYEHHLTEPLRHLSRSHGVRIAVISVFILLYALLGIYFHVVLNRSIAYTHSAYIPIILTGIWWGRRAILLAALMGLEVIALHFLIPGIGELWSSLVRVACFLAVAAVVGELSRRRNFTQRRLREANMRLSYLSRLQRDFLHITVHDLNSPVAASIALLHGLRSITETTRPDRENHLIERALSRLNEVSSFLRDFQFFAALDSRQIREQAVRIDFTPILSRVVDSTMELAQKKNHTVILDVPEALPMVTGIGWLLNETVMNLLTNAIKYTPDGGRIRITGFQRGDRVRVEVSDNGVGIAPEDQENLFREFVRIRRMMKPGERIPGIGLGLSIVKRVVELHGGSVFLESKPGEGSTFAFELPVCPPGDGPVSLPDPVFSDD